MNNVDDVPPNSPGVTRTSPRPCQTEVAVPDCPIVPKREPVQKKNVRFFVEIELAPGVTPNQSAENQAAILAYIIQHRIPHLYDGSAKVIVFPAVSQRGEVVREYKIVQVAND